MRDQWIRRSDGFLIMYAIDILTSFVGLDNYFESLQVVKDKRPNELPVVVVGNKADVDPSSRRISYEQGLEKAKSINANFFEASAKTCANVTESLHSLVKKMKMVQNGGEKKKFSLCILL